MNPITPRPMSQEERAVLEQALLFTDPTLLDDTANLIVVGECDCGCRTIFFRSEDLADQVVADVSAKSLNDDPFSVMVWANGRAIVCLDVVDYGSSGLLPDPRTFRPEP